MVQNHREISLDIVVPEANNLISLLPKPPSACSIIGQFNVTTVRCPVDFNDEAPLMTHKIDDVSSYRRLPSEQKTSKSGTTDRVPKLTLGYGHFPT
jgi:hypothetical protein